MYITVSDCIDDHSNSQNSEVAHFEQIRTEVKMQCCRARVTRPIQQLHQPLGSEKHWHSLLASDRPETEVLAAGHVGRINQICSSGLVS